MNAVVNPDDPTRAVQRWHDEHERAEKAESALSGAYRERAHLVALLAAIYPSTWGIDPDWTDWHVVYVSLPTGQASWHISPTDVDLFGHVYGPAGEWDGHSTPEKYQRIRDLVGSLTLDGAPSHALDAPEMPAALGPVAYMGPGPAARQQAPLEAITEAAARGDGAR